MWYGRMNNYTQNTTYLWLIYYSCWCSSNREIWGWSYLNAIISVWCTFRVRNWCLYHFHYTMIGFALCFCLLVIDRFIRIGFPYWHRNIMTTKVSYTLISVAWLIAAGTTFAVRAISTFTFEPDFGRYTAKSNSRSFTSLLPLYCQWLCLLW